MFKWPNVFDIWNMYLTKFIQRYVSWFKTSSLQLDEISQFLQTKETNFGGRKTLKFCSGGEKMRNASGHQGENKRQ